VKRETSESGNERRFTRYVSRVPRTKLADFFSILLDEIVVVKKIIRVG